MKSIRRNISALDREAPEPSNVALEAAAAAAGFVPRGSLFKP